jgi:hypothetical protein
MRKWVRPKFWAISTKLWVPLWVFWGVWRLWNAFLSQQECFSKLCPYSRAYSRFLRCSNSSCKLERHYKMWLCHSNTVLPRVFCAWPFAEYGSLDQNQTYMDEKSSNEYLRDFTCNFRGPAKILRSPGEKQPLSHQPLDEIWWKNSRNLLSLFHFDSNRYRMSYKWSIKLVDFDCPELYFHRSIITQVNSWWYLVVKVHLPKGNTYLPFNLVKTCKGTTTRLNLGSCARWSAYFRS